MHKVTQYKTGKASLYAQGEEHSSPVLTVVAGSDHRSTACLDVTARTSPGKSTICLEALSIGLA